MKQYKIIIKECAAHWEFEGPKGPFVIAGTLLPLKAAQLENLLVKCGFFVEWREE